MVVIFKLKKQSTKLNVKFILYTTTIFPYIPGQLSFLIQEENKQTSQQVLPLLQRFAKLLML